MYPDKVKQDLWLGTSSLSGEISPRIFPCWLGKKDKKEQRRGKGKLGKKYLCQETPEWESVGWMPRWEPGGQRAHGPSCLPPRPRTLQELLSLQESGRLCQSCGVCWVCKSSKLKIIFKIFFSILFYFRGGDDSYRVQGLGRKYWAWQNWEEGHRALWGDNTAMFQWYHLYFQLMID